MAAEHTNERISCCLEAYDACPHIDDLFFQGALFGNILLVMDIAHYVVV